MGTRKLDDAQVSEIRREFSIMRSQGFKLATWFRMTATQYGASENTIRSVVYRKGIYQSNGAQENDK